jgi:hypothetical protein
MLLIEIKDGVAANYPVTLQNFKALHPKVSFPKVITPEIVEPYGFGVYRRTDAPDTPTHSKVVEDAPQKGKDGVWVQSWRIDPMTADEVTVADAKKALQVRSRRDGLLQESDWVVIKSYERGENIPAEWELYRQALRDITAQAGFPYSVEWPTKP